MAIIFADIIVIIIVFGLSALIPPAQLMPALIMPVANSGLTPFRAGVKWAREFKNGEN